MNLALVIFLITILSILGITLLLILSIIFNYIDVFRDSSNSPRRFLRSRRKQSKNKSRVIFLGDSLTRGNMSVNYTKMVENELGNENYIYINAGANSELTYHVIQRLDEIIKCNPDFIIILIGTNDANRELRSQNMKFPIRYTKLPKLPDFDWFKQNLRVIVSRLIQETKAKIAICSIPPLGEDLKNKSMKQCQKYSNEIRKIVEENKITYLPVFEQLISYLEKNPSEPKYSFEHRLIERAFINRRILRMDLDKISEKFGFSITTDHIHLNSNGAVIVANLASEFIKNN